LRSTPREIATGLVNSDGTFSQVVRLPADTPVGAHSVTLTGFTVEGAELNTVAWFTLGADGRVAATSISGPVESEVNEEHSDIGSAGSPTAPTIAPTVSEVARQPVEGVDSADPDRLALTGAATQPLLWLGSLLIAIGLVIRRTAMRRHR
jgi:hypothetical protein